MTSPQPILIATGNPGKYREIVAVLTESLILPVRWLPLSELGRKIEEPVEDGPTFAENAALKARWYSTRSGLWTLADDSGLEVDALGGAPGVFSARFAGEKSGTSRLEIDAANNRKLIAALAGVPAERRTARFRCCVALADGKRVLATAEGVVEGRMIDEPRGTGGFGYDPHFLLPDLGLTTAELPSEHKNRISHRGGALRMLAPHLERLLGDG